MKGCKQHKPHQCQSNYELCWSCTTRCKYNGLLTLYLLWQTPAKHDFDNAAGPSWSPSIAETRGGQEPAQTGSTVNAPHWTVGLCIPPHAVYCEASCRIYNTAAEPQPAVLRQRQLPPFWHGRVSFTGNTGQGMPNCNTTATYAYGHPAAAQACAAIHNAAAQRRCTHLAASCAACCRVNQQRRTVCWLPT